MSTDLTTKYLGLDLDHPVVPSASPLTGDIDHPFDDAGPSTAVGFVSGRKARADAVRRQRGW